MSLNVKCLRQEPLRCRFEPCHTYYEKQKYHLVTRAKVYKFVAKVGLGILSIFVMLISDVGQVAVECGGDY